MDDELRGKMKTDGHWQQGLYESQIDWLLDEIERQGYSLVKTDCLEWLDKASWDPSWAANNRSPEGCGS